MTHLYRYHPQLFATSFQPALNIDTRMVVPSVILLIFRLVCFLGMLRRFFMLKIVLDRYQPHDVAFKPDSAPEPG